MEIFTDKKVSPVGQVNETSDLRKVINNKEVIAMDTEEINKQTKHWWSVFGRGRIA